MCKIAYVCSPYGGQEENVVRARKYMVFVANQGYIPVAPHVMLHGVMDDSNPEHRASAMKANVRLLDSCDILCVCGDKITVGMKKEIKHARKTGKPIIRLKLLLVDQPD